MRIGTPAVTTRGMKEQDMEVIAGLIDEVINLSKEVSLSSGKTLKDFLDAFNKREELIEIKKRVQAFSCKFSIPGSKKVMNNFN